MKFLFQTFISSDNMHLSCCFFTQNISAMVNKMAYFEVSDLAFSSVRNLSLQKKRILVQLIMSITTQLLRSEISFLRTCNISNLISHIYRITLSERFTHRRTGRHFTGGRKKFALKLTTCPKNRQLALKLTF